MAVTAWKYPTITGQTNTGPADDWTNPENVTASDDANATVNASFGQAEYLEASGFGFDTNDIPPQATIVGVEVEIEGYTDSASVWRTNLKVGGSTGTLQSTASPTTETTTIVGGPTNTFGMTISDTDARSSTTTVQLSIQTSIARVDGIRLRYHYTPNDGSHPDPLDGITLTKTITASNSISSSGGSFAPGDQQVMHAYDGVMSANVSVPASFSQGVIFEIGALGQGAWLGYQTVSSQASLVWRGGDGGSHTGTASTGKAEIIVPYSLVAGKTGDLTWEWEIATGGLRLWFNNNLLGEATCGTFESDRVAATNDGTFDAVALSVASGCPTARASGINGNLSYYYDQTSSWEPNTVPLKRTSKWLGLF